MKSFLLLCTAAAIAAAQVNAPATAPVPAPAAPPVRAPKTPTEVKPAGGQHGTAVRTLSYKDLKFPALPKLTIPDVATFTLPNGMKLYLLENHELPLVRGTALVRAGNLFDPKDKVGLSELTGTVMRTGGTKSMTGEQIDELLENMAASVETGIGETSGSVSFSSLKENTDEVLAVLKDVLTNPEFRQNKLDLAKSQMKSGISRRNDDASSIASRELDELVYGKDTPFGWELQYEHVDRIQRDDLVHTYKRYFFPANIMFAIQGDFSSADMRARIEKLFADWTYQQPPVPPFPEVTAKPAPGVYLAVKDDVTQSFIEMGHLGGTLRDKDFPALSVLSDILGGGFSSRLFRVVRTQKGLAYGISAAWSARYNHAGVFRISGSTKSGSTVDTIQATLAELTRVRTEEVTNEELSTAKQSVLNSFVFQFDSPSKTLNRVVTYDYYGYPKDFIFQYQKAVEGVTKADILRVAKEHIHPELLTKVIAGNPQEFGKPLSLIGEVKNIDLTIPEPAKPKAAANAISLEEGRKLLGRLQSAMGGTQALSGIKDFTQTLELQVSPPQGGTLKAAQTNEWIAPNQFRQTQELPFGKIIAYFDGKTGWFSSPQGTMAMPPPVTKQVEGEIFRNVITLALSDKIAGRTVNRLADNKLEIVDPSGEHVAVDLDPSTGLLSRMTYQSAGMGSGPASVTATYSDWRDVSGVKLPHGLLIEQGGQKFAEGKVTSWKLNSGLSSEELNKKP